MTLATTSNNMADVHLETQENPNQSIEKTKKFLHDGCACAYGSKGGPCSREFQEDTMLSNLNNCLELTSGELDLVILANIQAFTRNESTGSKRSRITRCNFQFQSVAICKDTFLHLYGLSYSRFLRLKEHCRQHGLFPRTHGNSKRLPSNTLHQRVTENVHNFLTNYVEENPIALPGRIPGFKKLLVNKHCVTANSLTCGNSSIQGEAAWPSGLRRWVKAPVSSEA